MQICMANMITVKEVDQVKCSKVVLHFMKENNKTKFMQEAN